MFLRDCPKWEGCSAPICPLDPDWQRRVMRDDESVCYLMLEAVKPGAEAVFRQRGYGELFATISDVQTISSRWGRVKRQLERAKTTGSRMTRIAPWETRDV